MKISYVQEQVFFNFSYKILYFNLYSNDSW